MERPKDPDKLRNEAIEWLVRLRSPTCTEAERQACDAWLMKNPRHREAYAQAEAQWRWMEAFKSQRFRARDDALRYRPRTRRSAKRLAVLAAAASVVLACGVTALGPDGWYGVHGSYAAAKGGREVVALADGSRLDLNTDSEVKVHINRWGRRVELVRGEVFFSVAHDADRPFEVRAGGGRITDLGTAFEVYLQPEKVLVAVQEGSVRVEALGSRDLSAGQQIAYALRGDFVEPPAQDIASLTAWRQGQVIFRDRPLTEVLAEIGRYHDTIVRVSDPAQGRLRVSGAFRTARLEAILDTIAMTLPVKAEHLGDHEIVLKPAGKRR